LVAIELFVFEHLQYVALSVPSVSARTKANGL